MLERLRRVSFLGFFSVAALAGCDRPERELAPPAVLKSTTPSPASDTTLYYDYQHKPVMLAIDPSRIVVEATTDPRSIAASVLQSLGVGIASSTPLIQAHGHWLLQLSGGLNAASAQAAAAALHADRRFTFVSSVFRTVQDSSDVVPVGRVAVQFKPGVAQSQVDSLTRAFGLGVLRPPRPDSGFSYYVFSYPRDSVAPLRVAVALDRNPLVAWADPDKISNRHPDEVPSDPYFSLQYYLSNTNTLNGIPVDDNVETAWDLTTGLWPPSTGGLRVGVIGTGVQASHPEFGGRVLDGYDAVLGNSGSGCTDCATSPYGNDYHETSVAGIIVGQHDGSGIAGIAPGVFIVPARIFRGDQVATDVGIADAIYYTWYYGAAEVINNSWGGGTPSDAITNAINSAATSGRGGAGTVVVFAAGNTSNRDASQIGAVDYPAYLDTVIAVGAIDRYGYLTNYTPEGSSLDIVAPSGHYTNPCVGDVVTTDLLSTAGCNDGPSGNIDYTSTFSGTSAAAPQVAAVAALVIARQSSLSMSAVKNRLYQGADYWGPSTQFGWGKLNAYKSVTDVTVVITGTKTIRSSGDYSWNCSATGGNGTYSYRWDESDNQGPYYEVGTSSTYSDYVDVTSGITTIDLRCTVTSGVETGVGNFRANVIPR